MIFRWVTIIVSLFVFLVVLEIGTRVINASFTLLPPPAFDSQGLVEHTTAKGYELYEPTSSASLNGHRVRINALGFRGAEFHREESSGEIRILFLGDSITFGQGVAEEETYPEVVGHTLASLFPDRRFVIVNASNQGASTADEAAMLEDFFDIVSPHIIIFGFCDNDIRRQPVFHPVIKTRSWISFWAFSRLAHQLLIKTNMLPDYYESIIESYEQNGDDWKIFRESIQAVRHFLDQRTKATPVLALYLDKMTPLRTQYLSFIETSKEAIAKVYRDHGMIFLDTSPTLVQSGVTDSRVSRWDDHPDAKTHAVYARVLTDYFVQTRMVEEVGK